MNLNFMNLNLGDKIRGNTTLKSSRKAFKGIFQALLLEGKVRIFLI